MARREPGTAKRGGPAGGGVVPVTPRPVVALEYVRIPYASPLLFYSLLNVGLFRDAAIPHILSCWRFHSRYLSSSSASSAHDPNARRSPSPGASRGDWSGATATLTS